MKRREANATEETARREVSLREAREMVLVNITFMEDWHKENLCPDEVPEKLGQTMVGKGNIQVATRLYIRAKRRTRPIAGILRLFSRKPCTLERPRLQAKLVKWSLQQKLRCRSVRPKCLKFHHSSSHFERSFL